MLIILLFTSIAESKKNFKTCINIEKGLSRLLNWSTDNNLVLIANKIKVNVTNHGSKCCNRSTLIGNPGVKKPSRHLIVHSQQWEDLNRMLNLFRYNSKDPKMKSILLFFNFERISNIVVSIVDFKQARLTKC